MNTDSSQHLNTANSTSISVKQQKSMHAILKLILKKARSNSDYYSPKRELQLRCVMWWVLGCRGWLRVDMTSHCTPPRSQWWKNWRKRGQSEVRFEKGHPTGVVNVHWTQCTYEGKEGWWSLYSLWKLHRQRLTLTATLTHIFKVTILFL